MTIKFLGHNKRVFLCLLILGFSSVALLSQTDSLIINTYAKVLVRNDYSVTVNNATGFSSGDFALIIQMKGGSINITNDYLDYGSQANEVVGKPGQYEFIKIDAVAGNTISFLSKIKKYDVTGLVQIVRVPFYNSVKFDKTLTCQKWDSAAGTGGVLAIIAGGDLTLSSNIDVSGKGFKGGIADIGIGICATTAGITSIYSFAATNDSAGYKGEGIASHYSPSTTPIKLSLQFLKGQGRLFSGGGGGNGRFSGGGGGSNRGSGFDGGNEDKLQCGASSSGGGNGGYSVTSYQSTLDTVSKTGGVFMGGGGGSSTHLTGASATAGGNGGGIIFILTDSLSGNNNSIIAAGDSARTATGRYSGAGGGGAGGSVIIFAKHYSSDNLYIKVNGAKGGDVYNSFQVGDIGGGGTGGGGGGGYVTILGLIPPKVNIDVSGGDVSYIKDLQGSSPEAQANGGQPGLVRTAINPVLTGFLFNSIYSDVTHNQVDSICSNMVCPTIKGTEPMGGVTPYTYIWQKSTVSGSTGFTTISGAISIDYSPGMLSQTTWFKRIVVDNGGTLQITDNSKPIEIDVQPAIQNNIIVTNPDTICYHGDPQLLAQGTPDLIVPSTKYLKYIWQDSSAVGSWGAELTAETAKEFDPAAAGVLTQNIWYRRTVISGRCIDSGAKAKINVLHKIRNNKISIQYDTICYGGSTNLNTDPGPSGGDTLHFKYRYKWESSTTNPTGPWTSTGVTLAAYDPNTLPAGNHFYRRLVFSGEQDACKDSSNAATRKVWPAISNNVIKADQIIGYDSIPLKLTNASGGPLGGDGVKYTYKWKQDTVNLPDAPAGTNGIINYEYQPPNLTYARSFKRIVNSSKCTDPSNSVKITVDLQITNNTISLNSAYDTIYTGQASTELNGSYPSGGSGVPNDFSYKWYKSLTGSTSASDWTLIADGVGINLFPGSLTQTYWFRRDVGSPALAPRSILKSNFLKVTVLPKITNVNISSDQSVCWGNRPLLLRGSALLAGGNGKYKFTWQDSTAEHNWTNITNFVYCDSVNYKPPALTVESAYRRIVYSGKNDCGVETSDAVVVKVNPLPGAPDAGPDTTIYSVKSLYYMNAAQPLQGETGLWTAPNDLSVTIDNPTEYNTRVQNLSLGKNSFVWTVSTGFCELSDTINVTLENGIFIPQGFSPNGDAYNNTFIIEGLDLNDEYIDLKIVNGTGTEVFSTSNHNGKTLTDSWVNWEGKNSQGLDLSEGTYYYMLRIVDKDSAFIKKKSGFIILKRY